MLATTMTLSTVYGLIGRSAIRARGRDRAKVAALQGPDTGADLERYAIPTDITEIAVAPLCRDAMRDAEWVAHQHLTRLQVAVADGMTVRGDPRALRAALCRLIELACRAAPCGEVLVSAAPQGGRAHIAVTSDGCDIAVEVREAATGAVNRIVAMHGGTLDCEPTSYGGLRFVVRLLSLEPSGLRDDAERMAPPLIVQSAARASAVAAFAS